MNVSFNRVHLIHKILGKESNQNRRFKRQYALIDYVPDKDIKIETFVKKNNCYRMNMQFLHN